MKVYLAGPLGFSEAGRLFHYDTLIPLIEGCGASVIDPWTLTDAARIDAVAAMKVSSERKAAWSALNQDIARNNTAGIEACDTIVAVLDGTDVDSGTAAEIGYGFARGKTVLGYRGDMRLAADNEGAVVNLQVEYFIRASGGEIVTGLEALRALLTGRIAAGV